MNGCFYNSFLSLEKNKTISQLRQKLETQTGPNSASWCTSEVQSIPFDYKNVKTLTSLVPNIAELWSVKTFYQDCHQVVLLFVTLNLITEFIETKFV